MKTFAEFISEGKTITLSNKVFDELWALEYDTVSNGSPKEKIELADALEAAKKKGASRVLNVSDKVYEYTKKALENAIDIADDQNKKSLMNTLKKAMDKL